MKIRIMLDIRHIEMIEIKLKSLKDRDRDKEIIVSICTIIPKIIFTNQHT